MLQLLILYFISVNLLFADLYARFPGRCADIFCFCAILSLFVVMWIWSRAIPPDLLIDSMKQGNGYFIFVWWWKSRMWKSAMRSLSGFSEFLFSKISEFGKVQKCESWRSRKKSQKWDRKNDNWKVKIILRKSRMGSKQGYILARFLRRYLSDVFLIFFTRVELFSDFLSIIDRKIRFFCGCGILRFPTFCKSKISKNLDFRNSENCETPSWQSRSDFYLQLRYRYPVKHNARVRSLSQ